MGGIIVGLTASLPPGPTWILCLQRNLSKGFRSGIYSGIGAALCDTLYSLIAIFSLSIVTDFIASNEAFVQIAAGVIITFFGVNILLKKPSVQMRRSRGGESTKGWKDTGSAFLMVLANPTFILAHITFIATVKSLGIAPAEPTHVSNMLMVAGVFVGCMVWWTVLAALVSVVRSKFRPSHILWINRIAGSLICLLGIVLIVTMISDLYIA